MLGVLGGIELEQDIPRRLSEEIAAEGLFPSSPDPENFFHETVLNRFIRDLVSRGPSRVPELCPQLVKIHLKTGKLGVRKMFRSEVRLNRRIDWNLIHDLMDPSQPQQQVARVYPQLLAWIMPRNEQLDAYRAA